MSRISAVVSGAGDRRGRYLEARASLRPAVDVCLERARGRETMFELARIMGRSAKMIEQHYETLIDTAHDAILTRLEAIG